MLTSKLKKNLLSESRSTQDAHLAVSKRNDTCYVITYGQMYESPNLSFDKLVELSKLFGTTEIDVDDYSHGGCESCDYGSDYGHEIQIYNATLLVDELEQASK